jgi:hypothetical protein
MMLAVLQTSLDVSEEKFLVLAGSQNPFLGCPAHSVVTKTTAGLCLGRDAVYVDQISCPNVLEKT